MSNAQKYPGILLMAISFFISGVLQAQSTAMQSSSSADSTWRMNENVPESVLINTRVFRERLLADPYRPAYHFCVPEDVAIPGDPNGAFYYKNEYHLMYLYNRTGSGFSWGHVSSNDLLHWRHHPDALVPGNGDDGVFSGGAYVDSLGKATLTYWEFVKGGGSRPAVFTERKTGISIAQSTDKSFDKWEKSPDNPIIRSTDWGITVTKDKNDSELIYGSADPSNIWKNNGRYYVLTGDLLVLNKYGRKDDSPVKFQGDHSYLFVSDDLKKWDYLHEFYQSDRKWTDKSEDNMCASFMPLPATADGGKFSGKYLLLFISHNKGCQYYVGSYKNDRFYPDNHGRMTWNDNAYFAPEALTDGKGRQIMWSWIFDGRPDSVKKFSGWTGNYGLPRTLWLGEDGTLRMRPINELQNLRLNEQVKRNFTINADSELELKGFGKELLELEITVQPGISGQVGVKVDCSDDEKEQTAMYYDNVEKRLKVDLTKSSIGYGSKIIESAPFELKKSEPLLLHVFIDKGIVEIYANDRQAIGRSVYPQLGGTGVKLFTKGGNAKILSVKAWELTSSNPY